jgi:hypothetical protein
MQKIWVASVIKKTAQNKQSPKRRKFAQSGHPGLDEEERKCKRQKVNKRSLSVTKNLTTLCLYRCHIREEIPNCFKGE